ncbi:MAG: hypothetical protein AAGA56_13565 [Myxococcota bacterium]
MTPPTKIRFFLFAAAGLASVSLFGSACGSDVTEAPGEGQATTTTTTTDDVIDDDGERPITTTATPTDPGDDPPANVCEEACDFINVDCALPVPCSLIPGLEECETDESECIAACINGATCTALTSLVGDPDPDLVQCGASCAGPCAECQFEECEAEATACRGDEGCVDYLSCVLLSGGDSAGCLVGAGDNVAVANLVACGQRECPDECAAGEGGSGGGGGGAGGNPGGNAGR